MIASAQQPDGYLNPHYTIVEPDKRWTNLRHGHELYCAGHMIEAGVAHLQATGKSKLLDVVCRYADYIDTVFGREAGKKRGYCWHDLSSRLTRWTKPLVASLPLQIIADLGRSNSELIAENALLRQQLIILKRQVKRPTFTRTDRMLLVLLARLVRSWQQSLVIVQPETVLRWHRELFRRYWKRKSKTASHTPKVAAETIALIREMATNNWLWGAERIRGELLKLGIRVCKRTIQKYMRGVRTKPPRGQKWSTFLRNHSAGIWACDFLQVTDLFFRPLFAFFIVELKSRQVIHVGVTRSPTDAWVAQQLREATPYGQAPEYLLLRCLRIT